MRFPENPIMGQEHYDSSSERHFIYTGQNWLMLAHPSLEAEKLTGVDYMTRTALELMSHPDYSFLALQNIAQISKMTTEQIENLNLIGETNA